MMEEYLPEEIQPQETPWNTGDVGKGILLTIVVTIVILGLIVAFLALLVVSGSEWVLDEWFILLISGIPLYAAMVFAVWLFSVRKYRCGWRPLGFGLIDAKGMALGATVVLACLAIGVLYDLLLKGIGVESPSALSPDFVGTWYNWAMIGVFAVVVAPLAEETFFRGFIFQGLRKRFGYGWGVFISALLFSLAHLQPGALVPIFFLGLMLAWLYAKTKSIWPCIFAHFVYNSLALTFMIISY
ncbi:MAG: type II CAAX endopeptidase family protein [Chloroflexota bacterium]|nr:type II CAAX endopeptidase family protein [Chloroflexota bacterium]